MPISLILFFLTLLTSKDDQEPNAPVKQKQVIVSKAIKQNKPASKIPKKQDSSGNIAKTKTVISPKKKVTPKTIEEKRAVSEKDKTKEKSIESGPAKKKDVLTVSRKKYDTKGRVDPFTPLLREKNTAPPVALGPDGKPIKLKPKRILTPLEKMDLSQIKLVAVIEMKGRAIAMVEEANGKGYEVTVGTYMGRNNGQVSAIKADLIEVKEYVKDFNGILRERMQEIKFHKKEGEE